MQQLCFKCEEIENAFHLEVLPKVYLGLPMVFLELTYDLPMVDLRVTQAVPRVHLGFTLGKTSKATAGWLQDVGGM